MKNFLYIGKQPHNSTILYENSEGKKEIQDIRLAEGDESFLDETHPVIKGLIDAGLLTESTAGTQTVPTPKNLK